MSKEIWDLRLASDAEPSDGRGTRYWVTLPIENLDQLIRQTVHSYQNSHSPKIDLATEPSPIFPQYQKEYRALLAFQKRLEALAGERRTVEAGSGELPISFNDAIFVGDFISIECLACGLWSEAQQTNIRHLAEDDGMQYYGQERQCRCGQVIAYRIDGFRRP